MPQLHDRIRMDFKFQRLELDDDKGLIRFALVPDPRRYDWIEENGERALFDRFDAVIIPERVIAQLAEQATNMPMFFAPPRIDSARAYVGSRRPAIARQLAGEMGSGAEPIDPSAQLLSELAGFKLDFAIVSLDLVGSTRLATTLCSDDYTRLVQTMLDELSAVAPLFRGHVLKYTGDGLIVFIPGPSANAQNDLAIDCALTMRRLVYEALNPEFVAAGLPPVDIRVGVDAGEAAVLVLGSSTTKRHADIIGDVVSLACKVEAAGVAGAVQVGGIAARSMHLYWRELLEAAPAPANWAYTDEDGRPYPIYRVRSEQSRAGDRSKASISGRCDKFAAIRMSGLGFVSRASDAR